MSYISTCRNEENFANEIIAPLRITMAKLIKYWAVQAQ